jgi:hypothetical protein
MGEGRIRSFHSLKNSKAEHADIAESDVKSVSAYVVRKVRRIMIPLSSFLNWQQSQVGLDVLSDTIRDSLA